MNKKTWLIPVIVAGLLAASIFSFLDKWLWSNEVFNNLAMGLYYEKDEPALVRLKAEAIGYCDEFAPIDTKQSCRIYQNAIRCLSRIPSRRS